MASYEKERSSQDPEYDSSSSGEEKERDGAEADESVLLSEADLMTCNERLMRTEAEGGAGGYRQWRVSCRYS